MAGEQPPDRMAQGYQPSGRQDEDLAFAVRRISEFAQKYKTERDEYRALVQRLEDDLATAQDWQRRAEHWKEAARHYRKRYHHWLAMYDNLLSMETGPP